MLFIRLFLIINILFLFSEAKSIQKTLRLANFNKQGPFVFFTKLHIGAGYGQVDIVYTKGDEIVSQAFYDDISVAILNETTYSQFSAAQTCEEKVKYLYKKEKFNFKQETKGTKHIRIFDISQQGLWYFYVFSCQTNLDALKSSNEKISFTFTVLNNGSHFGQNQQTLYAYVVILIIWTILAIKFANPVATLFSLHNPSGIKITIFGGLAILGAAYLYRLIHLVIYNIDGSGIDIFEIIYLVLKNIGEAIITTVIVSVSWGWSIIHLNTNQSYVIIGVLTGIVNIVSLILSSLTEEHEQLFHHYDTIPGGIVLILRIVIFFVFVVGIINSLNQSHGSIVYFLRKLAMIGGSYLISWPATVLIVELTLPNYMHREVITFIEEAVHLCASTLICQMISNPESAYRKVSLNEDDNPLGMEDYRKK